MVKPTGSPIRGSGRAAQGGRTSSSPIPRRGGSITTHHQTPRSGSSPPLRCRSPQRPYATRRPISLGAPSRMPVGGIIEGGGGGTVAALGGGVSNMNLSSSTICPICHRDLNHAKALYGHMRWHTTGVAPTAELEQIEQPAEVGPTSSAAAPVVAALPPEEEREEGEIRDGGADDPQIEKVFVLPDLNLSPPPEDQ